MTNAQESSSYLLNRIDDIGHRMGTLTNKSVIETAEDVGIIGEITSRDILNFKEIVRTGASTRKLFRPPFGYSVLGFLIALKDEQEKRFFNKREAEKAELIEVLAKMWLSKLKETGSVVGATGVIAKLWQTNPDSASRKLLNEAYKIAVKKWEAEK